MAIKLVFDTVEDFKKIFNFFQILEEDSNNLINETTTPEIVEPTVSLDDFVDDKGTIDYDDLPVYLQEEVRQQPSVDLGKVLNHGKYHYKFHKAYFKTPTGHKPILISGSEALQIIPLIQQGYNYHEIYNKMLNDYGGFTHDEAIPHTIKTFIKRYDEMELNHGLTLYCNNELVNENPLDFVKLPELDDELLEAEDLWH